MSEDLRIGVVGAGAMGAAHVCTLTDEVAGARVVAVVDQDAGRAADAAQYAGGEAAVALEDLLAAGSVDAVVVASPDPTHADLVLACLAAGVPVLCEKPLALSPDEALLVVEAEVALGRRLVQVGFMRRHDPGFVALREAVAGVGTPRVVHAVHRNASSTTSTDDAALVRGSMVHEIDTVPWLLDDSITAVRVESPVADGFRDPQLATFWLASGAMAVVEVFVNARYGYDVRCEVVGTDATAALAPRADVLTRAAGQEAGRVGDDFVVHFADAYRLELAAWVRGVRDSAGVAPTGASAWDGYLAAVAAEAGVRSLATGAVEPVVPAPRPALYAPDSVPAPG